MATYETGSRTSLGSRITCHLGLPAPKIVRNKLLTRLWWGGLSRLLTETVAPVPFDHFEKLPQVAQTVGAPGQGGWRAAKWPPWFLWTSVGFASVCSPWEGLSWSCHLHLGPSQPGQCSHWEDSGRVDDPGALGAASSSC